MPRYTQADCGCTINKILKEKSKTWFVCKCGAIVCSKHTYAAYVDENNIAISKNAPMVCKSCYDKHPMRKSGYKDSPPVFGLLEFIELLKNPKK